MASLKSLPAPLPLLIAKELPDLKALDALRSASPLFTAVYTLHAAELLEYLMLATLHEVTIIEIRAHALLLMAGFSRRRPSDDDVERLYERAQNPLTKDVPVEAISLTLRTFAFLHSLGSRVATAKLQELYALPHRHAKAGFVSVSQYHATDGIPYDVPTPSPLDWTEEQRILKGLFQIRIYALLGRQIHQPPPLDIAVWQFSIVYECYRLFEDHLPEITQTSVPELLYCWQAPAARCDQNLQVWPNDLQITEHTIGWQTFHGRCALRSHAGRSPLSRTDWIYYSDLGMALWSHRRLALDLALVRRVRNPRSDRVPPNIAFAWWSLCRARIPAKNDEYGP
ncbi:hypothetical protein Q7P35_011183 [Cladosporium inversicolor]